MSICDVCGLPGSNACGACKGVVYCSRACQKGNWPDHKPLCPLVARLQTVTNVFQAQEKRVDAIVAKVEPKVDCSLKCRCCGLARATITDVMLSCCGIVLHGMCLVRLREDGLSCPTCEDPLPCAPEVLYEEAIALANRIKYSARRKTLKDLSSQICEVYNMNLESGKQGHVLSQMRLYEAHLYGCVADKNLVVATYWLSQAAAAYPVTMDSADAKVKFGDLHYAEGRHNEAKKAYYGALFFYSGVRDQTGPHKGIDAVCAKLMNRMGHMDKSQRTFYLTQATLFAASNAGYKHDLAVQLTSEGNFTGAEDALRGCLMLDNACVAAHHSLGILLTMKGEFKKAGVHFQKVLKLDPLHKGSKKQLLKLHM